MSSFNRRVSQSAKFEQSVFDKLAELNFIVAKNGTEHTHPEFVRLLSSSTDQTSLTIRFQPDGVICAGDMPKTAFVEIKYASTIEKNAYEQYYKLYENGNVVCVIFGKLDWRWNFIEDILLIDGEQTVSKFSPNRRFPVIDNWIEPRQANHWQEVQVNTWAASGTAYKEVDNQSLIEFSEFRISLLCLLEYGVKCSGLDWSLPIPILVKKTGLNPGQIQKIMGE